MNLISTSRVRNYWERFPSSLRLIIEVRLWTAIGAGGVLYLSPIIFNSLGFSAEQIGSGMTTAAFAGIITKFGSGYLLDKKFSYIKAIKIAYIIAIISDYILFFSNNYSAYLYGQLFLGAAAGIYWPSIELAVPLNCKDQIKANEGYALARSADAIGLTLGLLIGTIGTYFELTRIIYLIDGICILYIFYILKDTQKVSIKNKGKKTNLNINNAYIESGKSSKNCWILDLFPLLSLTLFVTGVMTLLQIILPLDLAIGGVKRPPLTDQMVATFLTIKIILIAFFQWPISYLIRNKNSTLKFRLCLIFLLLGFILLSLSNFLVNGYLLILLSFIPLTIALCIFLPSVSNAIIISSPIEYRASAIALYSQCFGISALTVPLIAGRLIDTYETALQAWLIFSLICILLMPICKKIK